MNEKEMEKKWKRKRILVVEDEEKNRYLISFILEKNGLEVVTANDGLEGVEVVRKQRLLEPVLTPRELVAEEQIKRKVGGTANGKVKT